MVWGNKLKGDVVTSLDAAAQAFGAMGPIAAMAFYTFLIASEAGFASPLVLLLSGLASIAIGYVVAQFAMKYHLTGAIYNYLAITLGKRQGFMGGWVYLLGWTAAVTAMLLGIAGYTKKFFIDYLAWDVHWFPIVVAGSIILALISYFDVRLSTRVQLTLVSISAIFVIYVCVCILMAGGAQGISYAPFSPASSPSLVGIGLGFIFGILVYIGFDSAAVLAEEAKATASIPMSIIFSVVIVTIFYVFVSFSFANGYGQSNVSEWAKDTTALATMTKRYVGDWGVPISIIMVIIDTFAVAIASLNAGARLLYAMAREDTMPHILTKTQPKHGSPFVASSTILTIILISAFIFSYVLNTEWTVEFELSSAILSLSLVLVYIYISFAGLIFFRKERPYSFFKHFLVPIIALIVPTAALISSLMPQGGMLNYVPIFIAGWIIIGFILSRLFKNKLKSKTIF